MAKNDINCDCTFTFYLVRDIPSKDSFGRLF